VVVSQYNSVTIKENIQLIELRKHSITICCSENTYTFKYELGDSHFGLIYCDHLKYLSVDFVFE
jgi:hypothetical protein